MANIFPLEFGPEGRSISVDADGKIVAVSEDGGNAYVYGYGSTGRPLAIDASGRLILSSLSNIVASGVGDGNGGDGAAQAYASGAKLPQPVYVINNIAKLNDKLYVGTKNWFGSTSGSVYGFWYDETNDEVKWEEAFVLPSASGWPATLENYRGKIYTGPMEGAASGWIFSYDGSTVSLVGAVSGQSPNPSTIFGMAKYDNKLVITVANNLFTGPHPVFYYDGTNFGELYRGRTTPSQWGWIRNPVHHNGKLYTFQSTDKYINVFDGIRSINFGVTPAIAKGMPYKGKLYLFGTGGVWELNEQELTISKVYDTGGNTTDYPYIYNGDLYFHESGTNNIIKFDGDTFLTDGIVGNSVTGIGDINGRLIIVCNNGAIYTRKPINREALSHGKDDFRPHAHHDHTEYIKKILDFIGSNYIGVPDAWGTVFSTGKDNDRYPQYTSLHVVASGASLASGVSKLDQVCGTVAIPPSGNSLPSGSSSYGQAFYHSISGFFRYGQNEWEQQTTPVPHHAELWQDTTPLPGESLSLGTAETFYRFPSNSASGGIVEGHGIFVNPSGIIINDIESEGDYHISYSVSFTGTASTIFRTCIFINDTQYKSSCANRGIGTAVDVGNVGSQTILALDNGDEINLRFAANGNSKTINIETMNLTMFRVSKHT
jgi:hypothetical protein